MNPWQRKAQERYGLDGAILIGDAWVPYSIQEYGGYTLFGSVNYLWLDRILDRLTYERQECERCRGNGWFRGAMTDAVQNTDKRACPACHGTGLSSDYRKAQEWAGRLGLEDG